MKFARLALTASLLALSVALSLNTQRTSLAADVAPANSRQALNQTVRELVAEGQTFAKVIDYLRNVSGANIVVNWNVLAGAGIEKETTISLTVREVPLRKVLQLVLNQAAPQVPLAYSIDANVIQVTTQSELDKQIITKVYIVDDLVMVTNNPCMVR